MNGENKNLRRNPKKLVHNGDTPGVDQTLACLTAVPRASPGGFCSRLPRLLIDLVTPLLRPDNMKAGASCRSQSSLRVFLVPK